MWRFTLLLTILAMSNSHVFYRTISSLVFILWGSIITYCVDFFTNFSSINSLFHVKCNMKLTIVMKINLKTSNLCLNYLLIPYFSNIYTNM